MRRNLMKYLFWQFYVAAKRKCFVVRRWLLFIAVCALLFLLFTMEIRVIENKRAGKNHEYEGDYGCEIPHLDPRNNEVMRIIWDTPPIKCKGINYLEVDGSTVSVRQEHRNSSADISCEIREVIWGTGEHSTFGNTVILKGSETYTLQKSDFIYVTCFSGNRSLNGSVNVMAGIRVNVSKEREISWKKVPEDALRLNVLILAFDSVSRSQFLRKMPRSLEYMRKELEVVEFEKYNVLGDGTTAAIIPLMTGSTEEELPETRRDRQNAHFVDDVYPFIWDEFKRRGYVTSFAEDGANIGTFFFRLRGFRRMPTHHSMRHFFLRAQPLYRRNDAYCLGATPRHLLIWKYAAQLFSAYRHQPKFMFAFYSEITHEEVQFNWLGSLDQDFADFLKELKGDGHLQRTLLVIMSDHGPRFSRTRNTTQGKFEERLPFLAVSLPDWFKAGHPDLYGNLKGNARKLVTTFDLHATLQEVLRLDRKDRRGRLGERAISLFKDIPADRSCVDAQIGPHWCMCLKRLNVSVEDVAVRRLALFAVSEINSLTRLLRHKCAELSLDRIMDAVVLGTSMKVLLYGSKPRRPFAKRTTTSADYVYQLKLTARPGAAMYEVSVQYNVANRKMALRESAISRLNAYEPHVKCLSETERHVLKYCFCVE